MNGESPNWAEQLEALSVLVSTVLTGVLAVAAIVAGVLTYRQLRAFRTEMTQSQFRHGAVMNEARASRESSLRPVLVFEHTAIRGLVAYGLSFSVVNVGPGPALDLKLSISGDLAEDAFDVARNLLAAEDPPVSVIQAVDDNRFKRNLGHGSIGSAQHREMVVWFPPGEYSRHWVSVDYEFTYTDVFDNAFNEASTTTFNLRNAPMRPSPEAYQVCLPKGDAALDALLVARPE